jgi:hypothetical protein
MLVDGPIISRKTNITGIVRLGSAPGNRTGVTLGRIQPPRCHIGAARIRVPRLDHDACGARVNSRDTGDEPPGPAKELARVTGPQPPPPPDPLNQSSQAGRELAVRLK